MGSLKLAAVAQATGRSTIRPLRTRIGWIAADNVGDTPGLFGVTSNGRAVRLDRNGRIVWRATTDTIEAPPTVGLGSIWVASRTGLYRINAVSGRVEVKIPIRGAAAELAIGGGYVWMISLRATKTGESYELFKIDSHPTRVVTHVRLAGPVGPIAFGNGALWMGRATPTVSVIRIDPRTLQQQLFAKNLG
jgi:outer membrane protein assembly factor BamB